jgi:hypothetical protein
LSIYKMNKMESVNSVELREIEFKDVYLLIHMHEDGHGQSIVFACVAECYSDFEKKLIKYYSSEKMANSYDDFISHIDNFIEDNEDNEDYEEWGHGAILAEFGLDKVLDDHSNWRIDIWKSGSKVYLE